EDRIDRHGTDRSILVAILVGRDITLADFHNHLHLKIGILGTGCNVMVGIKNLNVSISKYRSCCNNPFTLVDHSDYSGLITVNFKPDTLKVQNDICDVLSNSWYS